MTWPWALLEGCWECGQGQEQQKRVFSKIRTMVVDHVINHGMAMTEANKNIHFDVDENLWPNLHDRVDGN